MYKDNKLMEQRGDGVGTMNDGDDGLEEEEEEYELNANVI